MPDRPPRPGDGRRTQYELPAEYGTPREAAAAYDATRVDVDHDEDTSVRTVHRDAPAPDRAPARDRGPAPAPADVAAPEPTPRSGTEPASRSGTEPASRSGTEPASRSGTEPAPVLRTRQDHVRHQQLARAAARGGHPTKSPTRKWIGRGIAVAVVLVLIPVVYSYVSHLRRPGTDSLAVKSVEWFRDHGGNGFVNTIERWWYTNNPPPTGGRPDRIEVQSTSGAIDAKPTSTVHGTTATTLPPVPEHLPPPTGRVPTPAPVVEENEGVWMPVGRQVGGLPAEYITFVRPDAVHTSYYTAIMWLDTKLLNAAYVPGLNEPGGGPNPWGSQIPPEHRETVIAAFNSGFKMDQARGGVYFGGQEVRGLVPGAASLVIYDDGRATVGVWGRDAQMAPDVASVRQNLELLVDDGQLNPELREDDTTAFGATLGNKVHVWRSGVGVDANGALIYAGGPAMSVVSLAKTLQNAGAVRAMELDINTDWVSAYTYVNQDPADPSSPVIGIKLGGDMARDGSRYLQPGERDFFAFFADPQFRP